jgi:hypothetical protein
MYFPAIRIQADNVLYICLLFLYTVYSILTSGHHFSPEFSRLSPLSELTTAILSCLYHGISCEPSRLCPPQATLPTIADEGQTKP